MIGCAILISTIFNTVYQYAAILVFTIVGLVNINNSIEHLYFADVELNYTRMLKAQVEFCQYMETTRPKESIYAPFLVYMNLSRPYAGFIEKDLKNLNPIVLDTSNVYYINTSNETCKELDSMIANKNVYLVKRFENHQAKVELFKR
jgi:hypothetical protein